MTRDTEKSQLFVDLLAHWNVVKPAQRAYTFLDEQGRESSTLTFSELFRRATVLARRLETLGRGARVMLVFPQGPDFAVGIYACMCAGVIPIPCSLPNRRHGYGILRAIAEDSGAAVLLSTSATLNELAAGLDAEPSLGGIQRLAVDVLSPFPDAPWHRPSTELHDIALLQYTSGSTNTPKGVCVTHANFAHNQGLVEHTFQNTEQSVFVSWLPMFHDLGLNVVLSAVWTGMHVVVLTPLHFIKNPVIWLRAMSYYQATATAAPDFAYELCCRRVPEHERTGLDLSSVRVAMNGSEPVRPSTVERFAKAYGPYGFPATAHHPAYGLAEATLVACAKDPCTEVVVTHFAVEALEARRAVVANREPARAIVAHGKPWPGTRIAIVDPETREPCPSGTIGEIWLESPSVCAGYWQRGDESERTFRARTSTGEGPFLRTGDLGFEHDGSIYISGRIKDVIIVRGRNHYPQDIENTASQAHVGVEQFACAAFSIESDAGEQVVLVQELSRRVTGAPDVDGMTKALARRVAEEHGIQVHAVVFLKPSHLPRTTSGKVQRSTCRKHYLGGTFDAVATRTLASTDGDEVVVRGELEVENPLHHWLVTWLAQHLDIRTSDIDATASFADYGMDSVSMVELSQALSERVGTYLDETILWDFTNIQEVVKYLAPRRA